MRILISLSLLLLSSSAAATGCFDNDHFSPTDWDFCQPLQDDHLFLYYKPLPDQGNVMIGLHATQDTFGWTALALAGNGGMKGASQIVVRQNDDGVWIAEDRNSQDYVAPSLDDSQDVQLLFASQSDEGETAWGVLLPLNSCDEFDYPIEDISRYRHMHWALGETHAFGFHGDRRGQFHANLFRAPYNPMEAAVSKTTTSKQAPTPVEEDTTQVELLMPNVDVVLGEGASNDPTNPYICTFFDLSELMPAVHANSTVHVTRLGPVLDQDSSQYVHHMILYSCENQLSLAGTTARKFEHGQVVDDCQSMPPGCSEMKWAWAVGGQEFVLPPNVGVPFGGEGTHGNWLGLQMHYYNPSLDQGIKDSSGVRFSYTEKIREHGAGYLQLNGGTSGFMRPQGIPAGHVDYKLPTFIVPPECTEEMFEGPINVLGVSHHMHLTGQKMDIELVRDGHNLGPLRYEKHYDFNHQSGEPTAHSTLLPGDQFNVHCSYDTSSRQEDIEFGDLTQNEMCYSVLLYYPKQDKDQFGFGFLPLFMDKELCTSPGSSDNELFKDVSLCAQRAFENVPKFYDFEDAVEAPFDGLFLCNSDFYESTIMPLSPGICPDCYKTKNCTAEEVVSHQQYGTCQYRCHNWAGFSVYPDVSRSDDFDQGMWGCGSTDLSSVGLHFFQQPATEEFTCTAVGDLTQEIQFVQPSLEEEASLEEEDVEAGKLSASSGPSLAAARLFWFLSAANVVAWMV